MSRLASLDQATRKKLGPAVDREQATLALLACIPFVDPWARARVRMTAFPRDKRDGTTRWVFSSGVIEYAKELLVKDVAKELVSLEATQFMAQGGLPALERWLGEELPKAALVITTDVPSCFDRVFRDAVEHGLPLPGRVKEEVLFRPMDEARYLERTPKGLTPVSKEKVAKVSSPKRGIPQGSAASSIASEAVIARVIRRVCETSADVRMASFGDNLVILLRKADAKQSALHALTSEIEACFGADVIGELTSRTRTGKATQWFSFCGLLYRRHRGKMEVRLDQGRVDAFAIRTMTRIQDGRSENDPGERQQIERSIYGWVAWHRRDRAALEEGMSLLVHLNRYWPRD